MSDISWYNAKVKKPLLSKCAIKNLATSEVTMLARMQQQQRRRQRRQRRHSDAANVLAPFLAIKAVLSDGAHPTQVSLVYMRNYLRLLGLWPGKVERPAYRLCNVAIMTLLIVFIASITCDLYEASGNFLLFGDDLVVLLGLSLILFKIWLYRCRVDEIESIISELSALHERVSHLQEPIDNQKMLSLQRKFFLCELSSFISYLSLSTLFFAAISMQPLFSNQALPFRAKYPLGLHDPKRHSYLFGVVYIFQCICAIYNLIAIVCIDNIGCHMISQTTLNLKILCLRIRQLGLVVKSGTIKESINDMSDDLREIVLWHQQIISLIERISHSYYSNYVAQMGASTFMICLTAFEALLAKDEPMVAIKFQMFMLSAFLQLFYWCWMGNMVYYDSLEVATAAFEIHKWFEQSPKFQRNLMFLIQRAQKPLVFRARPFYAFTFQSFTSILSTSYSYFALLRTMND